MVKAGVFLLARMHPALGNNPVWFWLLTLAGSLTVLWAIFRVVQVKDLKALLAYTTLMVLGSIAFFWAMAARKQSSAPWPCWPAFHKVAYLWLPAPSMEQELEVKILDGLQKMPWTAASTHVGLAWRNRHLVDRCKELMFKAGLEAIPVLIVLLLAALAFVFVAYVVAWRPFWTKPEKKSAIPTNLLQR